MGLHASKVKKNTFCFLVIYIAHVSKSMKTVSSNPIFLNPSFPWAYSALIGQTTQSVVVVLSFIGSILA